MYLVKAQFNHAESSGPDELSDNSMLGSYSGAPLSDDQLLDA